MVVSFTAFTIRIPFFSQKYRNDTTYDTMRNVDEVRPSTSGLTTVLMIIPSAWILVFIRFPQRASSMAAERYTD